MNLKKSSNFNPKKINIEALLEDKKTTIFLAKKCSNCGALLGISENTGEKYNSIGELFRAIENSEKQCFEKKGSHNYQESEMEFDATDFINKPCDRCDGGERLICGQPCKSLGSHSHECPDCGRKIVISQKIR